MPALVDPFDNPTSPEQPQTKLVDPFDGGSGGGVLKTIDDIVRSVAEGMTFGYSNEFAAAMGSLTGIGGERGEYKKNLAQQSQRYQDISPAVKIPGEIAGATASTVAAAPIAGVGKVAQVTSKLPGWLRAVLGGSAVGGAFGSGEDEGDILSNTAEGALYGAAGAGAMYPIARGVQYGAGKISDAIRSRLSAPGMARTKLSEAIARDELTPGRVATRLRELGPQATIADAGGENVMGLGRAVAGVPGVARNRATQVLNQRAAGEGQRIAKAAQKGLGSDEFYAAEEAFLKDLRSRAAPLYEEAYKVKQLDSPNLNKLLERPIAQKAMREAASLAQIEGRRISPLDPELTAQARAAVQFGKQSPKSIPQGGVGRGVTTEAVDDLKRGLDSLIDRETNELTGRLTKRGALIAKFKSDLLKEVDRLNPSYKQARSIYAGDAEVLQSLRMGRDILKKDPEIIRREMSDLSESSLEAYRTGAARAIKDVVDKTTDTGSAANRLFNNARNRSRFREVFPNQSDFNEFSRRLIAEQRFAKTKNTVLGGSPTAEKIAGQKDLAQMAGGIAGVFLGSNIPGAHSLMLAGMGRRMGESVLGKRTQYDKQLSQMLFNRNQPMNQQVLDDLLKKAASGDVKARDLIYRLLTVGAAQQSQSQVP